MTRVREGRAVMTVVEARVHFSRVLNEVRYGKQRVVIEKHGKPKCAIVPMEDYKLLETMWPSDEKPV